MTIAEDEMNLKIEELEKTFSKDGDGHYFTFAQDILQLIQYTRMIQRHNVLYRKSIVNLSTELAETIINQMELNGENV